MLPAPKMSEPLTEKKPFESMAGRNKWLSMPSPLLPATREADWA